MATEFRLPELGENIESGNVVKVLVAVGDKVEQDQPVVELETDKATIEVPTSVAGIVKEIRVSEGGKAKVGEVLLVLEDGAPAAAKEAKADKESKETKQPAKKAAPAAEEKPGARVEAAGETASAVTPEAKRGDRKISEPEPSDQEIEERSKEADVSPEQSSSEQEEGGAEAAEPAAAEAAETPAEQQDQRAAGEEKVADYESAIQAPAAPSVRRLAREIGVDINKVKGSGERGRISIDDVKQFAKSLNAGTAAAPASGAAGGVRVPRLPDFSKWGKIERKEMNNIRIKTAEHMTISWTTIPSVTQYDKADVTELEEIRKNFGSKAEAAGGKLTITAILIKVVASALRVFPQFNASVDMSTNQVVYKQYYHIGVAVDTDRGLLVPVIRNVDIKNILQLSIELNKIAEKARSKKLTLEDMQGGTFTITNLGGIGGTHFSPIINHPEVAILGISRGNVEPVWLDGKFEPRTMLPLSLTYDHRLIDGADAARFLKWITQALKDPFLMAFEG